MFINPFRMRCEPKHVSALLCSIVRLLLPFQLRFGNSIGIDLHVGVIILCLWCMALFWMIADQLLFFCYYYYAHCCVCHIQYTDKSNVWRLTNGLKWNVRCTKNIVRKSWLFSSQLFLFRDFCVCFFPFGFFIVSNTEKKKRNMETWAEVKFFGCLLHQVTECGVFFFHVLLQSDRVKSILFLFSLSLTRRIASLSLDKQFHFFCRNLNRFESWKPFKISIKSSQGRMWVVFLWCE